MWKLFLKGIRRVSQVITNLSYDRKVLTLLMLFVVSSDVAGVVEMKSSCMS